MGISKDHLELVAYSNSLNHVSHSASHSPQNCVSLLLLKPHTEFQRRRLIALRLLFTDLDRDVLEAFGESSEFTFDSHFTRLDVNSDSFRDL